MCRGENYTRGRFCTYFFGCLGNYPVSYQKGVVSHVQTRKITVPSGGGGEAESAVCRIAPGTAGRRQRGIESRHAVYVTELPHQGPEDQGSVSGHCRRGAGAYGNGSPDHQSPERP